MMSKVMCLHDLHILYYTVSQKKHPWHFRQ